jgi:histidine decarboxylase
MVVFRLCGENHLTERLLKRLNARGNLHCVPAALKGRYVIRFTVTSQRTTGDDITHDWAEIRSVATEILGEEKQPAITARARVPLAGTHKSAAWQCGVCEISSSHGGVYDVHSCLLGYTAV